jgi:signal transduction histidine kinase
MNQLYLPSTAEMVRKTFSGRKAFVPDSQQNDSDELVDSLQAMDRNKNQFLAILAHELRNPLAPIKCALEAMGGMHLNEDVESLRRMMNRQIDQMTFLIDELFDVSRIHCGKITIRQKVVALRSIIDSAIESSATFIEESGQTLRVSNNCKDLFVFVDAARLTQVLSNLLNNAAKYSGQNCLIDLQVNVEAKQIVIRVRDNGVGISADQLKDIFILFNQVPGSVERGPAGLGIGLTLVKTLVELHRGTVTAESDGIGHGSVFTIRLPAIENPDNTEQIQKQFAPSDQQTAR